MKIPKNFRNPENFENSGNLDGSDALRRAMAGIYTNDFADQNLSMQRSQIQRNIGSQVDSPIKSLEFLFKSGTIQKHVLKSSPDTFLPWLKYVHQILNGLWLSPLTKANPYKIPKKETWPAWDKSCVDNNRIYMPDLVDDCRNNKIFHQYLDNNRVYQPITKSTPVDVINAMFLLVLAFWPSLVHILHQILVASIDQISLPFLIPESVGTSTTIRSMFFNLGVFTIIIIIVNILF